MKQLLKTKLSNTCIISTVEIEPATGVYSNGLYETLCYNPVNGDEYAQERYIYKYDTTSIHNKMDTKFSHFYISKEAC